jgi:hypothetical protein
MKPKQPHGPPLTLGNMRKNGHTPSLGAELRSSPSHAQHDIAKR